MPYAFDLLRHLPPRPSDAYQRTRLFRRLDQARAQFPIIWICSPPGAGKSTLVSSYLQYRQLPCSWYQFTPSDVDPASFLDAFKRVLLLDAAPQAESSESAGPLQSAHPRDLFADLRRRFAAPILVFDDCHELSENSDTYGLLSDGLESRSEGAVIFISRSGPPPALARQYMNREMLVIGWDDLQLTPEESLGIASLLGHKPREQGAVLKAHEKAAGWMAGLVLMLQEMRHGSQKRMHSPYTLEKSIQDYLQAEVFGRLDSATRGFLMATAQLQCMNAETAEQLTGNSEAQAIFAELCHKHYFTERHELPRTVYQYNPLFRGFLLTQAEVLLDTESLAALRRRAASVLETSGQIECAALQLIKIQDWQALLCLVERHAGALLQQDRVQTIESWLLALPAVDREAAPWALYWLGMCQLTHTERTGSAHFERAFGLFKAENDRLGMLLSWSGVVNACLGANDYSQLDTWVSWLDDYLPTISSWPTDECEHRVATSMFAALLYRQPHRKDIGEWSERVKMILRQSSDAAQNMIMTRHLMRYQVLFGDSSGSAMILEIARMTAVAHPHAVSVQIQYGMAEGLAAWFSASYEECLTAVRKALDLALESGMHRWDFELYGLGACASIGRSKFSDAQDWLQKMSMTLFTQPRSEAANYHYLSAWCAMARGDLASAQEHADAAHYMYTNSGAVYRCALVEAGLAHIRHERGDRTGAAEYLARAQQYAETTSSAHLIFVCGLMSYHQAAARGDSDGARSALIRTFSVGRMQCYENSFWWLPRVISESCALALSIGIETDYAQGLVRRHELVLDSPPLDIEHWPWQIKVYTLGRFSLIKQGQPLWASRKAQHKPLELLKVLIAYGGREVSVDLLASVLWPDAEGDAASNSFDITLHRLRKLIGSDKIINLKDGRLTLDGRYCWVDTWAIERMIGQADFALRSDKAGVDIDAIMRKSSAVLSLYQGHYLGKEYFHPWAITLRERLRSKFLRHVTDMGHFLETQRRWDDAVVYYKKGLEVDDLAEQFYQSLMLCYRHLGCRSEALAVYRRCRSTLSIVLGIEPAPATEAIHASLLS